MNLSVPEDRNRKLALTVYKLNMGGISTFILELGKSLKSKGYEVSVICTDGKGDWYERIGQEGLQGRYFRSRFWEWVPFGRFIFAGRIGRFMRKEAFDYIINNHSYYIHAAAGYFYGRSRIIHVVNNQLEQMVEREADPMSDKIVGVSPFIEELARQHLPERMVTSILNGINLPGELPGAVEHCSDRPRDILFLGRIEDRQKGVFQIPEMLEYLLEREFRTGMTVVGDGPDFLALKQMVETRSLSEYITFTGKVASSQVSEYYASHKILVMPSNFEGFPHTLMEAMSHGCVPVSSLLPQCTDICVEHGKSGILVELGNTAGYGKAIMELLEDRERLNNMSQQALIRAREEFSNARCHQRYLELLESLEDTMREQGRVPLINRKYLTWKEVVPFQLVLWVKRKV
jgi:glycosyltransferase involved in cell wall biosynthesis